MTDFTKPTALTPLDPDEIRDNFVHLKSTTDSLTSNALISGSHSGNLQVSGYINSGASGSTMNSLTVVDDLTVNGNIRGSITGSIYGDSGTFNSLSATGNVSGANLEISNWNDAYTHVSNDGTDHSYIDQDVKSNANVEFNTIDSRASGSTFNSLQVENNLTVNGDISGDNLSISNWNDAHSHVSANGSSHSYIDQDVTTGADVEFNTIQVNASGSIFNSLTVVDDATFGTFPTTPLTAPSNDYEVANKKYVDDNGGSVDEDLTVNTITTKASGSTMNSLTVVDDLHVGDHLQVGDDLETMSGYDGIATDGIYFGGTNGPNADRGIHFYFYGAAARRFIWKNSNQRFEANAPLLVSGNIMTQLSTSDMRSAGNVTASASGSTFAGGSTHLGDVQTTDDFIAINGNGDGLVVRDSANGNLYRIRVNNGSVEAEAL